jgi:hypothetical protein
MKPKITTGLGGTTFQFAANFSRTAKAVWREWPCLFGDPRT